MNSVYAGYKGLVALKQKNNKFDRHYERGP